MLLKGLVFIQLFLSHLYYTFYKYYIWVLDFLEVHLISLELKGQTEMFP